MAKGFKREREVEKVVYKTVPDGYTLEISEEEAQALVEVLARVGGDPHTSSRKHTEAVFRVLEGFGLKYTEPREEVFDPIFGRSLYFRDNA